MCGRLSGQLALWESQGLSTALLSVQGSAPNTHAHTYTSSLLLWLLPRRLCLSQPQAQPKASHFKAPWR